MKHDLLGVNPQMDCVMGFSAKYKARKMFKMSNVNCLPEYIIKKILK